MWLWKAQRPVPDAIRAWTRDSHEVYDSRANIPDFQSRVSLVRRRYGHSNSRRTWKKCHKKIEKKKKPIYLLAVRPSLWPPLLYGFPGRESNSPDAFQGTIVSLLRSSSTTTTTGFMEKFGVHCFLLFFLSFFLFFSSSVLFRDTVAPTTRGGGGYSLRKTPRGAPQPGPELASGHLHIQGSDNN